jgi:hypothetical protein
VTNEKYHVQDSGETTSSSELPDRTASEYNLLEDIFSEIRLNNFCAKEQLECKVQVKTKDTEV